MMINTNMSWGKVEADEEKCDTYPSNILNQYKGDILPFRNFHTGEFEPVRLGKSANEIAQEHNVPVDGIQLMVNLLNTPWDNE